MELIPYQSLEGVQLRASRDEIRNALNASYKECRDILGNKHDFFTSLGLKVFYDRKNKCSAVEAVTPAQPSFQGVSFLGKKFSDLSKWLLAQDNMLEFDETGVKSSKLGIELYIPDLEDDQSSKIESILLYSEDYYSQDQEQLQKELLQAYGMADMSEYTVFERLKIRIRNFLLR